MVGGITPDTGMVRARILSRDDCLAQHVTQLDRRIQRQRGQRMVPIKEAGGVVVLGLKIDNDSIRNRNDLNFPKCPTYGTQKSCAMQPMLTHGNWFFLCIGRAAMLVAPSPTIRVSARSVATGRGCRKFKLGNSLGHGCDEGY
jgi:hypothetical protein